MSPKSQVASRWHEGEIGNLFGPVATRPRRSWMPTVVLVLGFLSIIVLVVSQQLGDRLVLQHLFLERSVDRLELSLARSHLWLEEYLTGDQDVDVEAEVWGELDHAIASIGVMRRGGKLKDVHLEPMADLVLDRLASRLEGRLLEYRELSVERFEDRQGSGVGSTSDQHYDAEFRLLIAEAETLRDEIDHRLEEVQQASSWWQRVVTGAWSFIVLLAVAGLFGRERRHLAVVETVLASRRWLAATLSSIGDAVVTTDLEGKVTYINPVAEQMLGWRRGVAVGRPVESVVRLRREADDSEVENPVLAVLRSGRRSVAEESRLLIDHDGARRVVDDGAAPIKSGDGELRGAVLVFRDASPRRQAEAELRQSQQLEAVGRLAGGIAHDVSNYLGAIRGYCEVAAMKAESGPARERRMAAAMDTCDKVAELIRQLLAFSRRQPIQPEVVDLGRVVSELEPLMRRLLGEDVSVGTRIGEEESSIPQGHCVLIDPTQAEQALVNLLVNARDAMPRGGRIVIEISRHQVTEETRERPTDVLPGSFIRLAVTDTGEGIAEELRTKIFDPFFSSKDGEHSGLGLATVYGIVRQNGGFVRVESAVGEGTTFHLYFPASASSPLSAPKPRPAVPGESGHRILLVEDNAAMREATRDLLEALGHQPTVAESAEMALELLDRESPFALVITDVVMPGMSGKDLADRLRERGCAVPMLFISGYTNRVNLHLNLEDDSFGRVDQGTDEADSSAGDELASAELASAELAAAELVADRVHFLEKPFGAADLAAKISQILACDQASSSPASR